VKCPVHWIEVYPVESVNHLSKNWALTSEINPYPPFSDLATVVQNGRG